MYRLGICACWLAALGALAPFASAQSETTTETNATNHLGQLANCRDGIVDAQARPEGRRRWINTLLAFDTPEARQLVVELLKLSTSPEAQRAICEVIAHDARTAPRRLSPGFIDPLLLLLDTDDDRLRLAAVRALANFPGEEVSAKLRTLAGESNAPVRRRLAAIDALASKVNQREVVGELMTLLDADVPQITARVLQALEPLADERLGTDVDRWQTWWADKSQLSEEAWLAGQLHLYEERLQTLSEEFNAFRTNAKHRHATITARLGEFQRDVFRTLSDEEREGRLTAWLDDPLPEVQRTALAIIKAQIADEGQRPAGEAQAALLRLLRNGSPPVRRDVLQIVQTLSDPTVVTAVLDQLQVEEDLAIRQAILKAVGKLNRVEGVPALVAEIGAPTSTSECIREAAVALGQIASGLRDSTQLADAGPVLTNRYQSIAADDTTLRGALLMAMAGVASLSSELDDFRSEFTEAVESDDAVLLRPAARGLRAIGDRSKLPRLRTLTSHADALVRAEAAEAVGDLGSEDADSESLLTRLNPNIESDKGVRDAAWQALQRLVGAKSTEERINFAERLRKLPDLQVQYLTELADGLPTGNGQNLGRQVIYERLAFILVAQGRHGDAAGYWRNLYDIHSAAGRTDETLEAGVKWLEAALQAPGSSRPSEVIDELAADADELTKTRIIDTVTAQFDALATGEDAGQALELLRDLRTAASDALGTEWDDFLNEVEGRLQPSPTPPSPDESNTAESDNHANGS